MTTVSTSLGRQALQADRQHDRESAAAALAVAVEQRDQGQLLHADLDADRSGGAQPVDDRVERRSGTGPRFPMSAIIAENRM